MSTNTIRPVANGVNVDRLAAMVQAVQQDSRVATFQFRASNRWINGGHNRSTIQSFYGAGQEDTGRTQPFVLDADEPPILLGEDGAANPAEYLLHALAACLTTSLVYHAAARGIRIDAVESQLDGDLDLQGFFGTSGQVRPGFQRIRAAFTITSDASSEQLQELANLSPIYDTITNPVPVELTITTRRQG